MRVRNPVLEMDKNSQEPRKGLPAPAVIRAFEVDDGPVASLSEGSSAPHCVNSSTLPFPSTSFLKSSGHKAVSGLPRLIPQLSENGWYRDAEVSLLEGNGPWCTPSTLHHFRFHVSPGPGAASHITQHGVTISWSPLLAWKFRRVHATRHPYYCYLLRVWITTCLLDADTALELT